MVKLVVKFVRFWDRSPILGTGIVLFVTSTLSILAGVISIVLATKLNVPKDVANWLLLGALAAAAVVNLIVLGLILDAADRADVAEIRAWRESLDE